MGTGAGVGKTSGLTGTCGRRFVNRTVRGLREARTRDARTHRQRPLVGKPLWPCQVQAGIEPVLMLHQTARASNDDANIGRRARFAVKLQAKAGGDV